MSTIGWQKVISLRHLVAAHFVVISASAGILPALAETPDVLERPAAQSQRITTSAAMLSVVRAGNRLVAVGERGGVIFSDDDGASWHQSVVPVSATLTKVYFPSENQGWAVGHSGLVLHTSDRGATWQKQLDGVLLAKVLEHDADMVNDAAERERLRSNAKRFASDGPDKPFLDVYFENDTVGFAIGAYGLFFKTSDGGKTWVSWQGRLPNPSGKHLYSICKDGAALYIAGEQGALFRSADGGEHFREIKSPYGGSYFGIAVAKNGALIAYGMRGNAYRSGDQGATWQHLTPATQGLLAAHTWLKDGTLVLVSHDGEVVKSGDAGKTFQAVSVPRPVPFAGVVQAMDGSLILSSVRGMKRVQLGN